MGMTDAARAASIATRQSRAAAHAADTIALTGQAQAAGAKTNVAIADYLNASGSRTSSECCWTRQRIGLVRRQAERAPCL